MKFTVRLPNGQVRPFISPRIFLAYCEMWPEDKFYKIWSPFHCAIQSIEAPF